MFERLKGLFGFLGLTGAVIAALVVAYRAGYAASEAAAQASLAKAQAHAQAVRTQVVTRYVAQAAEIHTVTKVIHDQIPLVLTPEVDLRFPLPRGAVRLHDAAAQGVLPGPAEGSDGAPSPVPISRFVDVVVGNYGECALDRARLVALQDWARSLPKATESVSSP